MMKTTAKVCKNQMGWIMGYAWNKKI